MDLFERENAFEKTIATPRIWKKYSMTLVKFLLIFSTTTLLMEIYIFFIHHGKAWLITDFILVLLYILITIISLIQMIRKLPMAAIMLASPIVPLFMLIIVLVLFPVAQMMDKYFHWVS